ncbi:MAG TPA: NAD(P)-binding domain-containing protein, partial [Gaiella sp.]|nr:NAD(P)-binding domain-containing protein [Gaiella sp.]
MTLRVAVLGLGEAGGTLASGLAAAGCDVHGWDPLVATADAPNVAVADADLVLSLTTAAHALDAARSVLSALDARQVYADLNTAAPAVKRDVAAVVGASGAAFADVALLGPVPSRGV